MGGERLFVVGGRSWAQPQNTESHLSRASEVYEGACYNLLHADKADFSYKQNEKRQMNVCEVMCCVVVRLFGYFKCVSLVCRGGSDFRVFLASKATGPKSNHLNYSSGRL